MKNVKVFGILFVAMATLTTAFAMVTWHMFTESAKFYGLQPGDKSGIIFLFLVFVACVVISGAILVKTIGWLVWCKEFRHEFGFKPPYDPSKPSNHTPRDGHDVQRTMDSIYKYNSREKYVKTAMLAEKFSFSVSWPGEYREEYDRAHGIRRTAT